MIKYILFTDKGIAKEFNQKLNDLFLPPNYPGRLFDIKHGKTTDGIDNFYIPFEDSTLVIPYFNRAANRAYKVLTQKEHLVKPLDLKKMQGTSIYLIEYLKPELIKSKTAMKKQGHFKLDKEARQFFKELDKAKGK